MTRWNEAVYVYEKTLPNGQKRLIEMTETQIVRHMRGRLKYPRYKEQTHLISDFMAIYYAMEKKKHNRNWRN
jgi:hypothetical protein